MDFEASFSSNCSSGNHHHHHHRGLSEGDFANLDFTLATCYPSSSSSSSSDVVHHQHVLTPSRSPLASAASSAASGGGLSAFFSPARPARILPLEEDEEDHENRENLAAVANFMTELAAHQPLPLEEMDTQDEEEEEEEAAAAPLVPPPPPPPPPRTTRVTRAAIKTPHTANNGHGVAKRVDEDEWTDSSQDSEDSSDSSSEESEESDEEEEEDENYCPSQSRKRRRLPAPPPPSTSTSSRLRARTPPSSGGASSTASASSTSSSASSPTHFNSPTVFARFANDVRASLLLTAASSSSSSSSSLADRREEAVNALVEQCQSKHARQASLVRQSAFWIKLVEGRVAQARQRGDAQQEARRKRVQQSAEQVNGMVMYACDACTSSSSTLDRKLFKSREGLVLHIRNVHENDRPWACPARDCDACYARKGDFRLHLHTAHLLAKEFACCVPRCEDMFSTRADLVLHLHAHHSAVIDSLLPKTSSSTSKRAA